MWHIFETKVKLQKIMNNYFHFKNLIETMNQLMDIRVQVWLGCQKELLMKYLVDPSTEHLFKT